MLKKSFFVLASGLLILSSCRHKESFVDTLPEVLRNTPGIEKFETKIDYSESNHWMVVPDSITKPVDVVYFYPTAYFKTDSTETSVSDIDTKIMVEYANHDYKTQATVFEESTNVFAPYYRQFEVPSLAALSLDDFDAHLAYSASQDPAAALDYYFENYNEGRPFIVAGHSQGSAITLALLKGYFNEHPELQERMIAAYPIGFAIRQKDMDEIPYLHFADSATDVNVVVSWNTEGPGNEGEHNVVVRKNELVINPLNWSRDTTYAPIDENIGSLSTETFEIIPGVTDAQITYPRAVVVVTSPGIEKYKMNKPEMAPFFGPDCYHGGDYTLFYGNLQKNVADRIETYLKK